MNINLAEQLKTLRKENNISQEKLAAYLGISYQAISKWENGNTYPDIQLLPEIARFFGVTIDELLQVEKLDEQALFDEYTSKAEEFFRNGEDMETVLTLWKEAYHKMPNNIRVREFLMSTYFDTDKVKYSQEIIELGMEIYNSDANMYYKGQAIREVARTYAELGDILKAEQWVLKSTQINHCQEVLFSEILDGDEMVEQISFFTHWALEELLYMARRIAFLEDEKTTLSAADRIETLKTVSQLYETVYKDDDMSFESLQMLYLTHIQIVEQEIHAEKCEAVIRKHLERAFECAVKASSVTEHKLTLPLLFGWKVQPAPSDNLRILRWFENELKEDYLCEYRNTDWFLNLQQNCASVTEK